MLCLFVVVSPSIGWSEESEKPRPDLLLILADDLAWTDLGCYGHPWHDTPNIDQLAASGMRLTQGYAAAPICSASRASILTGKTTARLGFEFVTKETPGKQQLDAPTPLQAPPFKLNLELEHVTVAEHLQQLGYQTAFFGKWHLNAHDRGYLGWSPTHGPQRQGFEFATEDFGAHPYGWKSQPPPTMDRIGEFAADSLVDRICDHLSKPRKQPSFVMASLFHVHTPVKTTCTWLLEKYERRIPPDAKNRDKRVAYAAFVETLDHYVGQMMRALEDSGQREQTLVVLTSDNGGHPEYTANGPLRGSKWNLYEGGVRVPWIVSWPGNIASGSTSDRPVIGYDLLPTLVDFAGGTVDGIDGISIRPLLTGQREENRSENRPHDRSLLWHFPYYHPEKGYAKAAENIGVDDFQTSKTHPHSAIRVGNYKLIQFAEDQRVELYDLRSDLSESQDIHQQLPDVAFRLRNRLNRELNRVNARRARPSTAASP